MANRYLEKIASMTKSAGVGIDIHGYHRDPKDNGEHLDDDAYDYSRDSRIKTPYDRKTNYKHNGLIAFDTKAEDDINKYTTDHAYSDTPTTRNLSKEDLSKIADSYKKAHEAHMSYIKTATRPEFSHYEKDGLFGLGKPKAVYKNIPYSKEEIDMNQEWGDNFLKKIDHLRNHKDLKFARLEWE